MRIANLAVTSAPALAYVMNLSGQTPTTGHFVAAADTLFGALQVTAAPESGLSPELLAAASSSGDVLGRTISPRAGRGTCCAGCRRGSGLDAALTSALT